MRFDRMFRNNSISTLSHASIITLQYSQTSGVLELTRSIPPDRQYLPIEMRRAGYHDKWHPKKETAAFDYYYCILPSE